MTHHGMPNQRKRSKNWIHTFTVPRFGTFSRTFWKPREEPLFFALSLEHNPFFVFGTWCDEWGFQNPFWNTRGGFGGKRHVLFLSGGFVRHLDGEAGTRSSPRVISSVRSETKCSRCSHLPAPGSAFSATLFLLPLSPLALLLWPVRSRKATNVHPLRRVPKPARGNSLW